MAKSSGLTKKLDHLIEKSFLGTINIRVAEAVVSLVPEYLLKHLLVQTIGKKFSFFQSAWTACLHHPSHLLLPRFDFDEIDSMVSWAKHRFQNADYFIISDLPVQEVPFDFSAMNATWITSIEQLVCGEKPTVVFCLFSSDEKLPPVLHHIMKLDNAFYYTPKAYLPTARFFHRNDASKKVLLDCLPHENELDTFDLADYENIMQAIKLTENLDGAYVEIGVYKGASAQLALQYMDEIQVKRPAYFLDLFEGFSYETAKTSSDAFWLGQFCSTSLEGVSERLKFFENKNIVKCNIISDELPPQIEKIAVCNIDVDIYEAVTVALEKVAPLMVQGGVILIEDQGHTPNIAGGYLAILDFNNSEMGKEFFTWNLTSGQALLIKK